MRLGNQQEGAPSLYNVLNGFGRGFSGICAKNIIILFHVLLRSLVPLLGEFFPIF